MLEFKLVFYFGQKGEGHAFQQPNYLCLTFRVCETPNVETKALAHLSLLEEEMPAPDWQDFGNDVELEVCVSCCCC